MHIFHIPSWYPCRHGQYTGISCENLIRSIHVVHPEIKNSVSLYQETQYRILFSKSFFREFIGYFAAKNEIRRVVENINLEFFYSSKTLFYSTRLGFNDRETAYLKHRENLLECIKKSGRPDVIHAQVTNTGGYAAWRLSKEFNIPYLITERYAPFPQRDYLKNADELIDDMFLPLHQADKVISVSPAFAEIISRFSKRQVIAIPNFLDEDFFRPSAIKKVKSASEFCFSTLALSYEPRKGVEILVRAIKLIREKGYSAIFRIGGGREDHFLENIKKLSLELGVGGNIEWFGKIDRNDVVRLMQDSDCFVLASQSESFGTVYIEALACGKPVIATRCGGPESIVNDINGFLVSVDNPEELADAMIRMMNEYKNFDQGAIRNDFLKRFSKTVVVEKYIDIYNEISRLN